MPVAGEDHYDVVVVGAGIHGAGIAQAAAAAGYSVLVLERSAVAGGTSSHSSKLIHGGLRYLETGALRLVYECLRERRRLLHLAPGLVRLVPCMIPVYRDTRRRSWQIRSGLSLYAALGGLSAATRFRRVARDDWWTLDGLAVHGLQAVYRYWDAQTDDAALTRAVMDSAVSLGATLAMPADFARAVWESGQWSVAYFCEHGPCACRARVVVNAAGPWADRLLLRIEPEPRRVPVELVQGTHVIVDGSMARGIYYVEAPRDRRAVFIMPWRGRVLVGTTETVFYGDPGVVRPLDEEIDYLTETLGHYFPAHRGAPVADAFAGLRVLPAGDGAFSRRSRETFLYDHEGSSGRLLTVYGGKLTAYRLTAERVMRRIRPWLPGRKAVADTCTLSLEGRGPNRVAGGRGSR